MQEIKNGIDRTHLYFLRKDHELNLWATYWVIALFF